jgi:hypothetical protein
MTTAVGTSSGFFGVWATLAIPVFGWALNFIDLPYSFKSCILDEYFIFAMLKRASSGDVASNCRSNAMAIWRSFGTICPLK